MAAPCFALPSSPFLGRQGWCSGAMVSCLVTLCTYAAFKTFYSNGFSLGLCRMIAIFDEDGGGDVDFQEFVLGLSAFSSKGNKEEKLKFAFKVYDIDRDGYISNGELFIVLKMMVGSNLKDQQLQQIVDKTIMEADKDGDGKISFEEFTQMVESTDVSMSMTLGKLSTDYHLLSRGRWLQERKRFGLLTATLTTDQF